jgi:hypothetical protein
MRPIRDQMGSGGFQIVFRDITARKQAKKTVKAKEPWSLANQEK